MASKTQKNVIKKPWIFNLIAVDFYNEVSKLPARGRGKWVTQLAEDLLKCEKIQTAFGKRLVKDAISRTKRASEFGKLGGRPAKGTPSQKESQMYMDNKMNNQLDQLAEIRKKREAAIRWFESQQPDFIEYHRKIWGAKSKTGTAAYAANCLSLMEVEASGTVNLSQTDNRH
ncbi:hypothetical protein [Trichlorobacter lovleyi]|uniref:hypothetical protein n=1 Tax=Trichlorobacter lovleyi TaxID=313985 RepID=UPI0023EF8A2B|nr:hypothetical protein [Trichlorobacter lovleyi]